MPRVSLFVRALLFVAQEVTFNIDGISLLEAGELPDDGLARELGECVCEDLLTD